jgi:NAD(P)-dependent dehydrogenase (short-subunit alcohol dehydrogenase family)
MKRNTTITWPRVPTASLELKGWNVAVVGGTGGLGRAISHLLASRGAKVIVVGQTFRDAGVPGIEFMKADLGLMREAERVAKELPAEQLDLLVLTTGIFAAPTRQVTSEGIERDMAVSYLSRLVIVREIASRLGRGRSAARAQHKPRVFVMGYPGTGQGGTLGDLNAEQSYSAMTVHMNTVAGNEMLVLDAASRYPELAVFGLNPGLIKTNIRDNFLGVGSLKSRFVERLIGWFMPSPETYAERITPLLVSPALDAHSGAMFDAKGQAIEPSPKLGDRGRVAEFLAQSDALVERARA